MSPRKVDRSKLEFSFWKKRDKRLRPHKKSICKNCKVEFQQQKSSTRQYCSYDCQDKCMGGPVEVRIERLVNKLEPNMCWEWRGTLNRYGYGTISIEGKTKLAHRVCYRVWKEAIAPGMFLCHTCDNRKCCNPHHLYQGTHADNMRDMVERGRAAAPNSKSTPEERRARLEKRIRQRVVVEGDCWVWQGKRNEGGEGYGLMTVEGKTQYTHRIAFKVWVGEIPKGSSVCHTCDNPGCCNPEHLFLGSHADNMRDMSAKGRVGTAKTTWEQRRALVKMVRDGAATEDVAIRYGVTPATVRRWVRELSG